MVEALVVLTLIAALLSGTLSLLLWRSFKSRAPDPHFQELRIRFEAVEKAQERLERFLKDDLNRSREEMTSSSRGLREELLLSLQHSREESAKMLRGFNESVVKSMAEMAALVEHRLAAIQNDNNTRLEQMRQTVDEKLQGALEKRLGESFRQVSERLEQVHKGLGEMQSLAAGVGDLKKVLSNVKVRGTWGEIQLGNLLEQVLTPDQFAANVALGDGGERVEYAIKLPGRDSGDAAVWLPIDSKFPQEDYVRLVEASDAADPQAAEAAARQLEMTIRNCARTVCEKYIVPPKTTDFAILFLPTEGLYAEALRRTGLSDALQRDFRVVLAGPTTLSALLNSLQMGFRTLAIQRRSSEVWEVLGAVKTEFAQYGHILERVKKKLAEASNTVDRAAVRTRAIEKKLRGVAEETSGDLPPGEGSPDDEEHQPPELFFRRSS
ncbi:MAG: DNA recombination protein RmuC [Bryobacteraceae bacterium]